MLAEGPNTPMGLRRSWQRNAWLPLWCATSTLGLAPTPEGAVVPDLGRSETFDRAFVLCRQDEIGNHEGWVVAVYVGDNEACKADMEHRQRINPNARYYVVDKKLNPKSNRRVYVD
jgi:hypothetical protein